MEATKYPKHDLRLHISPCLPSLLSIISARVRRNEKLGVQINGWRPFSIRPSIKPFVPPGTIHLPDYGAMIKDSFLKSLGHLFQGIDPLCIVPWGDAWLMNISLVTICSLVFISFSSRWQCVLWRFSRKHRFSKNLPVALLKKLAIFFRSNVIFPDQENPRKPGNLTSLPKQLFRSIIQFPGQLKIQGKIRAKQF